MSLIRTDLNVSPSFSRSGKTAASVNAVAMGQLKKELDYASRKAELSKTANTLSATNKEILSKVLDVSITGAPPSCSKSRQLDMASREQDMASSPRAPSSWKLSSSPTKDNSVKLPRSIDWDLIEEDQDGALLAGAGPSEEHVQLALSKPNLALLDELFKKQDPRPSASFMAPSRDSASVLSERSTQAPEIGRYNPKLDATWRRAPAIAIVDRSLLSKKAEYDEKAQLEQGFFNISAIGGGPKLKTHQPAPSIEKTTGRDKPVVGRIICTVGTAEQRASFGVKDKNDLPEFYDTKTYWEKGPGSRKVHTVPDFKKTTSRPGDVPMSPKKFLLYSQARVYSPSSHIVWTKKASGMKTVADLGDIARIGSVLARKEPKRAWDTRQDYREFQRADKVSSDGEFYDLAIKKPCSSFSNALPRDKDQAAIRERKQDKGGPAKDYDTDRARGIPQYHVVPFSKLMPRKPASEMSEFGKESPDVIYHPERSFEAVVTRRGSPVKFDLMVGRDKGGILDNAPESCLLTYPNANKPKKHVPTVNIVKTMGHKPVDTRTYCQGPDNDPDYMSRIMSESGRAETSLGFTWHPSDTELKHPHIPTPELSAGGKARPSMGRKFLDKIYNVEPAFKAINKRVHVPNLGQGASGQGQDLALFKAERHRLEIEIKSIIGSIPESRPI